MRRRETPPWPAPYTITQPCPHMLAPSAFSPTPPDEAAAAAAGYRRAARLVRLLLIVVAVARVLALLGVRA